MKQYFIGFFTGACLIASAVMFIGATDKNLGDITVNSITVVYENGKTVAGLSSHKYGGMLNIYNTDSKASATLTAFEGISIFSIYNADGKTAASLTSDKYSGMLVIKSADGQGQAGISANEYGGSLHISNADGEIAAKILSKSNCGILTTYNKYGKEVAYLGGGKDQHGLIILSDRYGDIGWGESGKK